MDFPGDVTATDPTTLLGSNGTAPAKAAISAIGRAVIAAASAIAARTAIGAASPGDVSNITLTRDSVVGIDWADYHQWNLANVPPGSFPLFGFYRINNSATNTPNPGDHAVALISLFEDTPTAKLLGLAGESRVNAQGTAQYVGHNSKLTYRQSGSQLPVDHGFTSCAHWADVQLMQSDNVTPLTTPGLYSTCYLATAIVGGDPLLRASFRGSDRFISTASIAGSATDGAIHAPNGGISCGAAAYIGGTLTVVGNIAAGGTITAAQNIDTFYGGVTSQNMHAGTSAAACMALISNAGACYVGKASTAHAVVPNAAGAFFVYDTTGIRLAGSATTVDSLKVGSNQVVGARQAAIANATDAASTITQLNALLAACRAHGLIAT
jgi:hypothetical protein